MQAEQIPGVVDRKSAFDTAKARCYTPPLGVGEEIEREDNSSQMLTQISVLRKTMTEQAAALVDITNRVFASNGARSIGGGATTPAR